MSVENLIDFTRGQVWPILERKCEESYDFGSDEFYTISIEEDQQELRKNPDQVHMNVKWYLESDEPQKQLNLRVGIREDGKVITIFANPNQLGPSVIPVNGDKSWEEKFSTELQVFLKHPEFCTIEKVIDD
ncbi:MAG TPA: hypothetical protein VLE44_00180 [Candidatus Saccharimonadales bacterium]|nr:hypothetical protein [Candidatus Saccharimonadales bacterium]